MYKTGLVSISFRGIAPKELAREIRASGLEYMEWGSDVHAPYANEAALKDIRDVQKETGVKCSSYGTYFRIGVTPVEEIYGYISAAKTLGTDILRLWCGNKSPYKYEDVEKKAVYEDCKRLAAIAEKENVYLCLECHNDTLTEELDSTLDLLDFVDSPNFLMYWQPNQHRSFEVNMKYAEKISRYTKVIHVFNWEGDNRYPLADGVETWKKYLTNFDDDKFLLLEFMPDDKIESLPVEAEALRRITE